MSEAIQSGAAAHAEHETSVWPMIVGVGVLLSALSLLTAFHWELPVAGIVLGGITLAVIAIGLAGWAREFYTIGTEERLGPWAVAAFILSEIIIFGTLFAAFWVARLENMEVWASYIPGGLQIGFAIWLTLILWASSFSIILSERAFSAGNRNGALVWLGVTFALGSLFVLLHMNEWAHLLTEGFTPGANVFASAFYGMTGVHTAHVIVGLFIHAIVFYAIASGLMTSARPTLFKGASMYWHFVDIMWLLVAGNAYLIGTTV